MHIMEGYLPPGHAIGWACASAPFLVYGTTRIVKIIRNQPDVKILLAASGAYIFILSALKIPSVTGSCSHPTGTGLGAALFGPSVSTVLGAIVLVFQALLLAHGGLSTLGANLFAMGVAGPFVAWGLFRGLLKLGVGGSVAIFFAAMTGVLVTYTVSSVQLALAFPDPVGGFEGALVKFMGIFSLTQVPLAVSEGFLTAIMFNLLHRYSRSELGTLNLLTKKVTHVEA